MAGYLRQLAEQTLQPMPRLHSAATLPYAQATQEWGAEEVESTADAKPRQGESAIRNRRTELPPGDDFFTMPRSSVSSPQESATQTTTAQPDRASAKTGAMQQASSAEKIPPPARRTAKAQEPPASSESHPLTKPTHSKNEPAEPTSRHSSNLRPEPPRPAPAVTRTVRAQARNKNVPRVRSANSNSHTAPEVHIHIGRIELTAATPAKTPQRETAATKAPMSLDQYLQQRRRNA